MQLDLVQRGISAAGQFSSLESRQQILYMLLLTGGAVFTGVILLIIIRKWMFSQKSPKDQGPALDIGSLEDMRNKGLLSQEEMRRVREAVVRQTLRQDEPAAPEPAPPISQHNESPKPEKISPQLQQNNAISPETKKETAIENPPKNTNQLNIEKLLERGLISKEEYAQLQKHFGPVK